MTLVPASDGLPAREVQWWNAEKLFYVNRYFDIFCTAMQGKWWLSYADFLSGPGLCVDKKTLEESEGSPLLAARHTAFHRIFLNDRDPIASQALTSRLSHQSPGRVRIENLDCNDAVQPARDFLFGETSAQATLGLAMIDPTGFQMGFESVASLTRGVRMDLIIIFMTGYLRRFIDGPELEPFMDQFFGTRDWRHLAQQRRRGHRISYRELLNLYETQLRRLGYDYFNDDPEIFNIKRSAIYHIVFASRHPLGADFFCKISRRNQAGQRRLDGF